MSGCASFLGSQWVHPRVDRRRRLANTCRIGAIWAARARAMMGGHMAAVPQRFRNSCLAGLSLIGLAFLTPASAQEKPIRVGLLYDLSGPFAAAGSVASQIGAQIAIDLTNERGGV